MKTMTKQEEIQTLQSLKGDTYFAQKFGQDIDVMCENIARDFPIELNCSFMTKEDALQKALKEQQKKSKDKFMTFAENVILSASMSTAADINKVVEGYIGKDAVIKFKHANNIQLTDEEIDYLVNNLK